MTVPIGTEDLGRKLVYRYDNTGKQVAMEVVGVEVTSQTQMETVGSSSETGVFYDDSSNRVKLVSNAGGVYYFVYDPTASIPAVIYEQGPTNRYLNIREPDGSLVSRETYDDDGERTMSRTYHFDGLGSTMALTNEHGEVTDRYAYDERGNLTSHTGPGTLTTDNPYQYVGRYGYYTHWMEPDFGVLQLGVRYYDPTVGRFTPRVIYCREPATAARTAEILSEQGVGEFG